MYKYVVDKPRSDFSSVGRAFDCSSFRPICGYQNVAGSNPASRKININILTKQLKYFFLKRRIIIWFMIANCF